MAQLRPYRAGDLDAIYRICLETGDSGKDATAHYRDPKAIGHIYAGPYGVLEPESAFVLEDEEGVGGYILGAIDTHAFEKRLEAEWWPQLRRDYANPGDTPAGLSPDARMAWLMHHPSRTPRRISEPYPSHLHIDMVPRFQGKGWGKRMIDTWLGAMKDRGSKGAHLGVGFSNERAVRFYRAYGFIEAERLDAYTMYWFAKVLNE
jgi:GNAT superfamily N-acetyltransferase